MTHNPCVNKARQGLAFALVRERDPHATCGRALNCRYVAAAEPVFANIRHHKRMSRFTLRGRPSDLPANTQRTQAAEYHLPHLQLN